MKFDTKNVLVILVVLSDISGLAIAFVSAYLIKFETPIAEITSDAGSVVRYTILGALSTFASLVIFARQGQYSFQRFAQGVREYILLVRGLIYVVLGITVLSFGLGGPPAASRTWIAIWLLTAIIVLGIQRFALRRFVGLLRSRGMETSRVVIAGANDQGVAMASQLDSMSGIKFLGFFDEFLPAGSVISEKFSILGSTGQIESMTQELAIDEVIFVPGAVSWEATRDLMGSQIHRSSKSSSQPNMTIAPGQYELASLQADIISIGNIPVVQFKRTSLPIADTYIKRIFDVCIGVMILLSTTPIFIGILLRAVCKRQWPFRHILIIGSDGRPIDIRVFNVNEPAGLLVLPNGWRRLPIVLSVLNGSMGLVGPRPRAFVKDEHCTSVSWPYPVKPGAIGIMPFRSHGVTREQWEHLENFYSRNYSIWVDISAIVRALVRASSDVWATVYSKRPQTINSDTTQKMNDVAFRDKDA